MQTTPAVSMTLTIWRWEIWHQYSRRPILELIDVPDRPQRPDAPAAGAFWDTLHKLVVIVSALFVKRKRH